MIALKNLRDGRYIAGPATHMELIVKDGRAWMLVDRVFYGEFNVPYLLRINMEMRDDSMEMLSAMSEPTTAGTEEG